MLGGLIEAPALISVSQISTLFLDTASWRAVQPCAHRWLTVAPYDKISLAMSVFSSSQAADNKHAELFQSNQSRRDACLLFVQMVPLQAPRLTFV